MHGCFPLHALQLNPAISDVCSWKWFMAFHSSYKGKDLSLQSLWHDFCFHQVFPLPVWDGSVIFPSTWACVRVLAARRGDGQLCSLVWLCHGVFGEVDFFHPVLQGPVGPQFSQAANGGWDTPNIRHHMVYPNGSSAGDWKWGVILLNNLVCVL